MRHVNTKRSIVLLGMACLLAVLLVNGYAETTEKKCDNPFFSEYKTPFGVPPFDQIKDEHFLPAFKKGMEMELKEVDAIANNPKAPTFKNTIIAYEKTGELLSKVSRAFFGVRGADTNEARQQIAREVTPLLSKHNSKISLNEKLFKRIKVLHDKIDQLKLEPDQRKMLEERYKGFVRSGALLSPEDKEKLKKINEELSVLGLKFSNNLLQETNRFKMFLDKKEDLAGLPDSVIAGAAAAAKRAGQEGKWLFTLHKPSWIPFLQSSTRRDLREKLYKGYINRGDNNNEFDNKKIIAKIAALRVKRANLMGYKSHADFRLERNMAKVPANVYKLLDQLWTPALNRAKQEARDQQAMIDKEGGKFKLASWDWWYYTEKIRKEKYNLDEDQIKVYFKLDNVRDGAFYVAEKLYGLKFIERPDVPKYHKDVRVFEVQEADGTHVGLLYTDYFYRESKRGGAWCGGFQSFSNIDGKQKYPIVTNVCNFPQPVGDKPSLISFENAETLFHEFGHALHSLLDNCRYPTVSNVPRDFVELPSQIMEHWCGRPEVLKVYARHYKTGEVIPDELVKKLKESSHFNQGFITTEYLAASYLDLNWHTLTEAKEMDTNKFESDYLNKIGLIPEIISRYRSTYFAHIIGGYDAGYYAYIWAEVLDCDAFQAFEETSLFDQKTAKSFRYNVLAGGPEDAMARYIKFRGSEPKVDGVLKNRGLK